MEKYYKHGVWKVEQKFAHNLSFALLLFCKGFESKKKYQLKKKTYHIFARAIGVRVGKNEIPCFLTLFGSRKRRFFQIYVFWAVLESGI
jgi:hypothetical protein